MQKTSTRTRTKPEVKEDAESQDDSTLTEEVDSFLDEVDQLLEDQEKLVEFRQRGGQ